MQTDTYTSFSYRHDGRCYCTDVHTEGAEVCGKRPREGGQEGYNERGRAGIIRMSEMRREREDLGRYGGQSRAKERN